MIFSDKDKGLPNTLATTLISRRGFNAGLLGAGMAAMLPAGQGFAQDATPKRGGHVRLACPTLSTSESFEPARFNKGPDYIRGTSVYSYLTSLDQQGLPQPEVATEWTPNAQATVWNFKFRQGISFSDGAPLTADDIIFSILRHKEESIASSARQLAQNIKSVTADGTDGFVIELDAPDVDLPVLVGLFQFAIIKNGTTDFVNPIGSGAFIVTEFQPGLRTILDRNPNYWKEGQPYIDRLEMFAIPDNTARANALMTGEVDLCMELRGNSIQAVDESDVASIFVTPSTRYTAIQAMMDRMPSQNVDLTMAMAHLIDRDRLLNTVIRGYGSIANDHIVGPNSPMFNADLPQRSFDPDKAKHYLQKSGIGDAAFELCQRCSDLFGGIWPDAGARGKTHRDESIAAQGTVRKLLDCGSWAETLCNDELSPAPDPQHAAGSGLPQRCGLELLELRKRAPGTTYRRIAGNAGYGSSQTAICRDPDHHP